MKILYIDIDKTTQTGSYFVTYSLIELMEEKDNTLKDRGMVINEENTRAGIERLKGAKNIAKFIKSVVQEVDGNLYVYTGRGKNQILTKTIEILQEDYKDFEVVSLIKQLGCKGISVYDLYNTQFGVDEDIQWLGLIKKILVSNLYKLVREEDDKARLKIWYATIGTAIRGNIAILDITVFHNSLFGLKKNFNHRVTLELADKGFQGVGKFLRGLRKLCTEHNIPIECLRCIFNDNMAQLIFQGLLYNSLRYKFEYKCDYFTTMCWNFLPEKMKVIYQNNFSSCCKALLNSLRNDWELSGENLYLALDTINREYGLSLVKDIPIEIVSEDFYKDFSKDFIPDLLKYQGYFLVIDCEGTCGNLRARETGGVLVGYTSRGVLAKLLTFSYQEVEYADGFKELTKQVKDICGNKFATLQILTFGSADYTMLSGSLQDKKMRTYRDGLFRGNRFRNVQPLIYQYVEEKYDISERKQCEIARSLGVQVVAPKHTGLADARTLFNILAYINVREGYNVLCG